MLIDKVLNNNVVISQENGKEFILMGRGLAFGKKAADEIDERLIEKRYVLSHSDQVSLLAEIPVELLEVADKVISYARATMTKPLADHAFLAMADHMQGVALRVKDEIYLKNFLMWDIKRFFAEEFKVGSFANELLSRYLGKDLPMDEAGFMALTLVNAELDQGASAARDLTMLMEEILTIVKYSLEIPLDENDIYVARFMTHLKFFCERILTHHEVRSLGDGQMFEMMKESYPQAYQTTQKIVTYLEQRRNYQTSEDEQLYLTIHLSRIRRKDDET
ncbi:PRD domain-containing protein [Streptococcus himalayensis]|uniref:Transcription antiterminator BglG n=1 Tax=Streptococcus himalayensis TaxID=1888195 RepID=A0A917EEE6_9STRE|nr:PRD domain-containing protein [Streptococcus himalayensis]GGE28415.1 transcription antiterminator BglG [Streptococcus himalayensis]